MKKECSYQWRKARVVKVSLQRLLLTMCDEDFSLPGRSPKQDRF